MKGVSIKSSLRDKWYVFPVTLVIGSLLWYNLVGITSAPKKANRLEVFIGTSQLRLYDLRNEMMSKAGKEIYTVNVHAYDEKTTLFDSYFMNTAKQQDIILVSEDTVKDDRISFISQYVTELDKSYMQEALGGTIDLLEKDEKAYAIKAYDKNAGEGLFDEFIDYGDKDYFLMMGKSSLHAGKNNSSSLESTISLLQGFMS